MRDGYLLRSAGEEDAAVIAEHRALMFRDMGLLSAEETKTLMEAAKPWIVGLLTKGEYRGWLLEREGSVVAGGGLLLRELGPIPGCLRIGLSAHFVNVYTVPAFRRLGLARLLVTEMLQWCKEFGIDQVTLTASDEGRGLYESLGFAAFGEMKLMLEHL